ncbi:NF-kappa-B inhibitor-like protein [Citrus sinensis]|nr:NF-kappa-B inhibitor-like protein [Citrus sinensis]
MEALSRISFLTNYTRSHFPIFSALPHTQKPLSKKTSPASLLRTSTRPVSEVAEEDILQMFFKDRELNGDFISKASDMFWLKGTSKFVDSDADAGKFADNSEQAHQVIESDNDDGFLKLSKTREWWLLGDNSAPINKKPSAKALQDDSERRTKLNFLKYEALKRELMLLSVGIGTACSGYCLITFSVQCSCLYLQLLYQHADRLSKEMVPQIFMQKKSKKYRLKLLHLFFLPLMAALYLHYSLSSPCISKHFLFFCRIGIRSEDLKDFLERSIKGSSLAISSPRLVIPATIYGLWVLSHRYFANDLFDFQIVPAMVGMFVYKAAALVQVYRDNEDLQLVFPENEEGSID